MQYPDAWFPPFEIVAETQDPDGEEEKTEDVGVVPVTEDLAQLSSLSQHPTTPSTYRLKETTKVIHSSVICKLTRICRHPWLIEEIKKVCVAMKQVQLEGWHLANLHVLRCLKERDDVPKLEQMFFYRCCVATLGNIEKRDRLKKTTNYETRGLRLVIDDAAEQYDILNTLADITGVPEGGFVQHGVGRSLKRKISFGERVAFANDPGYKMSIVRGHQRLRYDDVLDSMFVHDTESDHFIEKDLYPEILPKEQAEWKRWREYGRKITAYYKKPWDEKCFLASCRKNYR
ncbi:hypothetical protein F442_08656 [Phytophthora nicotianae P10297]|uniref:Uncharacterized protein n=1 Tax=Phytophthora nicotianae P10297 TaxID=1317064 RepID=W2ZF63_PHYNI|nr:hypothetical protein F442_08656 [Phytophthora nicotianae P10297]